MTVEENGDGRGVRVDDENEGRVVALLLEEEGGRRRGEKESTETETETERAREMSLGEEGAHR